MKKDNCNKLVWVSIFAIAMGFLEAAVVIYLRALYYPNGFSFPLAVFMPENIFLIELFREFATIVMLISIGFLAGKKIYGKFAYFLYSFAIWDIFYYIFLKLLLNWPESFLIWDLLFSIPIQWISPVLAPIICSITMIVFALIILKLEENNPNINISLKEWTFVIIGSLSVLYTFLYDYAKIILQRDFLSDFSNLLNNADYLAEVNSFVPASYKWTLFVIGEILILTGIYLFYRRNK